MNFSALLTASGDAATTSSGSLLMTFLPLLAIVVIFYFLLIRPQKKREKEVAKMRSNIQVGDEVITAGGIIGRVVSLKEDTLVIETGSDRSKVRIARWAVQSNNSLDSHVEEAAQAEKDTKEKTESK